MKQKSDSIRKLTIRTILVGIAVILIFVGIVFMYYNLSYKERREGIIKDGKMAASQSADQFQRYLSTNIDLIKFAAYTLDEMIANKETDQEISDYLVAQSTAVKNAVLENSTGLYAYINGRFFSGTNWEPPEGYDATIRPWYLKPMEHPGELTILEPYHDVQSGNTMLALGKMLCDGVSVVSVDVSLDQMQKLTEEAVSNGGADIEMILTGDGMVVTHSDINEVGKDYGSESGTLGADIFARLADSKDNYFELDFGGIQYIVYNAQFEGGWHCVSVHNASEAFMALNRILVITVLVVVFIVVVLGISLIVFSRRGVKTRQAMASSEAKSIFLSNMSHEIRTPINAVLGMNEMILRETEDKGIISYSESIKVAGQSLLRIVNDILDFSKIEAGKMEIIPVFYDLSTLLNNVVNMVKDRANEKGLNLILKFDGTTPNKLYGDEVRIRQVIVNLLTNAVKYTEVGSITFRVGFEKSSEESDLISLKVSVKDTGIGIKEEDMGKLFNEFERIEEERNRDIEGTGLGLNITRQLLEMMGSTLEVKSEYGVGSEFSFSLDQKVTAWTPLGDYEKTYKENLEERVAYKEKIYAPSVSVLAVDDNPMNLMVFTGLLKQTGINIDLANNGDEAIELTDDKHYDMIFLDHMMPRKDGIETLRDIRSRKSGQNTTTPAICLTANAIEGAKEIYLGAGFDDYLTKPIDAIALENMLIKYLPAEKVERVAAGEEPSSEEIPDKLLLLEGSDRIDIYNGIENSGGVDAYMSLLKIFYTSIDSRAEELKKFYFDNDYKNYTIKIHALKSSARIIGAKEFGEKAQLLENAGKVKEKTFIKAHHAEFMDEYLNFKDLLSGIVGEEEVSDKPVAKPEMMADAFEELRIAADDMDCDTLQIIFDRMKEYAIPEEHVELWNKLKESSDNYDYSNILLLLERD